MSIEDKIRVYNEVNQEARKALKRWWKAASEEAAEQARMELYEANMASERLTAEIVEALNERG